MAANKKTAAIYEVFGNKTIGNFYDCNVDELSKLMKNVVDNYDKYLTQAQGGREWVRQYLWSELQPVYLNLFKPQNVVFGNTNLIDKEKFQTNDKSLFEKMKGLFNE